MSWNQGGEDEVILQWQEKQEKPKVTLQAAVSRDSGVMSSIKCSGPPSNKLGGSEFRILEDGGRAGLLVGEDHTILEGDEGEPGGRASIAG